MALPEASRRLQATFRAAFDFGLSDEEVWEVVLEVTKLSGQGTYQRVARRDGGSARYED
jgi:hypothetical protein